LYDIKIRTRLRLGECQANHVQQFQTIALILSQTIGSGSAEDVPDQRPKDMADATRQLSRLFGK
jgi:hypothetical protein